MLDLGIDLDVWPWLWLGTAIFFTIIELTFLAGSFVILPFAISAFAASIAGFYDFSIEVQWLIFVGLGAVLWYAMYHYAKRWVDDSDMAPGVGADRLIGLAAVVTRPIDPADTDRLGRVSVNGETWGALVDGDIVIGAGTKVVITAVTGTRVVVEPADATTRLDTSPGSAPQGPPQGPPRGPPQGPPVSTPDPPPESGPQ